MGNTDKPLKPIKIVFDQKSRESYFEKLHQALKNLSIVDDYKEGSMRKLSVRAVKMEKTST